MTIWTSRFIISPYRTFEWNVMTIWISREVSLFNFEHVDMLCEWIGNPSEKLWPFEFFESFCCSISSVSIYYVPESNIRGKSFDHLNFSRASVVQFRASRYVIGLNRSSEWKVMTIWISRELLLFNFERLHILQDLITLPSKKLLSFEFAQSFGIPFRASRYITGLNLNSE